MQRLSATGFVWISADTWVLHCSHLTQFSDRLPLQLRKLSTLMQQTLFCKRPSFFVQSRWKDFLLCSALPSVVFTCSGPEIPLFSWYSFSKPLVFSCSIFFPYEVKHWNVLVLACLVGLRHLEDIQCCLIRLDSQCTVSWLLWSVLLLKPLLGIRCGVEVWICIAVIRVPTAPTQRVLLV